MAPTHPHLPDWTPIEKAPKDEILTVLFEEPGGERSVETSWWDEEEDAWAREEDGYRAIAYTVHPDPDHF